MSGLSRREVLQSLAASLAYFGFAGDAAARILTSLEPVLQHGDVPFMLEYRHDHVTLVREDLKPHVMISKNGNRYVPAVAVADYLGDGIYRVHLTAEETRAEIILVHVEHPRIDPLDIAVEGDASCSDV